MDVALLLYDPDASAWKLFRKDHERQAWELHSAGERLASLIDALNADPERKFWQ